MIFVFGGEFSGKGRYVNNTFSVDDIVEYDAPYERIKSAGAVRDFHLLIKKFMIDGKDIKEEINRIITDNPNIIIISNEIGCGVVPLDKFDREYRETAGRINCYLAERAESVIRVVCGIGVTIK